MQDVFRSEETAKKYRIHRDTSANPNICALCEKTPIVDFEYWKLVHNDFPYDKIAETHHMLVPKRHATERELTPEEQVELSLIKANHLDLYDYILEATPKRLSIPTHFHLHCIVGKP